MTIQEAITARHSVRQYTDKPIEPEKIEQIAALIENCNSEGGVHIQLVTNEPSAFSGGIAKYGNFSGIKNYITMVCKKNDDTKLGYYGEQIVLLAQTLGLNTCWVGLNFSKQPDKYKVGKDEKLICLVSLGYGTNQGVPHPQKKGYEAYCDDLRSNKQALPDWFVNGMKSALLAPTAVNQQKFKFLLHDGNKVEATTTFSLFNGFGYSKLDLGIAKYHFEIGAGKENFQWI